MCRFIDNLATMTSSLIDTWEASVHNLRRTYTTGEAHQPDNHPTLQICPRHHNQVTQPYQPQIQTHHLGSTDHNQWAADPILSIVQQINCPLHSSRFDYYEGSQRTHQASLATQPQLTQTPPRWVTERAAQPQVQPRTTSGDYQATAQSSFSTWPQLIQNAPPPVVPVGWPDPTVRESHSAAVDGQAARIRLQPSYQSVLYSNQLEIHHAIEKIIKGDKSNFRDLLTIMRGLFRQEELNKIADRKAEQLEVQQQLLPVNQRQTVDRQKLRLLYHQVLKERLQLLGSTRLLSCGETIDVSEQELQRAADTVLRLEKLDINSLNDFISENSYWDSYLQQSYQSQYDQDSITVRYSTLMDQLEEENEQGKINENEYLQRGKQLMREREVASKAWYRDKTQQLIHQYLMP
jgi:hypothetical protein